MGTLRVGLIEPSALNKVRLNWSEPANATDAAVSGNYSVTGGVTVSAAAVVAGSNNTQVDLTLAGLVNGTTYTVTVINVKDIASSTAIISPNEQGKFIWREYGDTNLNGVVEQGGIMDPLPRMLVGDQILGYNVLGNPDVTLPIIQNVLPASGTNINPATVISFDVIDPGGSFRRIIVRLKYPSGVWELVHDHDNFGPGYQGASNVRTTIAGGYHYTILRDGGWSIGANPILTAYAIDQGGNEAL